MSLDCGWEGGSRSTRIVEEPGENIQTLHLCTSRVCLPQASPDPRTFLLWDTALTTAPLCCLPCLYQDWGKKKKLFFPICKILPHCIINCSAVCWHMISFQTHRSNTQIITLPKHALSLQLPHSCYRSEHLVSKVG